MASAYPRSINAFSSIFNDVHGNQTNITNHIVCPKAFDWLRKASAPGALYNSAYSPSPCNPGTREGILGLIFNWVTNDFGVCWLSGPVGTGKSAIAQTISQRCENEGRLAATFFCSRRDADRSDGKKLISTIAYQLTGSFPSLKHSILNAVENDPLIFERAIPVQFQLLVVNPVILNRSILPRMVVVIDALDECDDKSAKEIAALISHVVKTNNLPLQFFITSRPASHIELPFTRSHSVVKSLKLHDFDVHDDIRLFLTRRFEEIYEDHPAAMREVPKPWPSDEKMDQLMKMSQDLFIFAASITRFIDDHNRSPSDRLETILDASESSLCAYAELDQLYKQTLDQCLDTESLRLVLGTIMAIRKPVPLHVMACLLRSQISIGHLRTILYLLRPVLLVPEDERQPVTTFHQSFRDFLTDEIRSGKEHFIDPDAHAVRLADSCLDVLGNLESLDLSNGIDPSFRGRALNYARTHYLTLLREDMVGDSLALELIQLAACNAVVLVASTLAINILNSYRENTASYILSSSALIGTFSLIALGFHFVLFFITDKLDHFIPCMFASICGLVLGGVRFVDPVICRSVPEPAIHSVTAGVALDLVIRNIFSLEPGMTCIRPAVNLDGLIMRTVTSGAALDLVIQVIIWTYVAVVHRRVVSPQLTAMAVWMTGCAAGRVLGSVVIHCVDINGAFWALVHVILCLASNTLLFNLQDIHSQLARYSREITSSALLPLGTLFLERPVGGIVSHAGTLIIRQRSCRWVKARYHYALKRREIPLSFTAPGHHVILVVEFYIATLKPTHVSATTDQERLYCDWCKERLSCNWCRWD